MIEQIPTVRVVTAPSYEPVTLAEAKAWCRVDTDDTSQDGVLNMLIQAMREYAEEFTGRAFALRTLQLRMNGFPSDEIELPRPPLVAVTSIEYLDADGTLQNLNGSPSQYQAYVYAEPGVVAPVYGGAWPATRDALDSVRITYTAGYAASGSPDTSTEAIPAKVKLWMQARLVTLYEQREQLMRNNMVQVPRDFVDGLLDGLRIRKMFA